ncbi:MAG: hypothetical protein P8008_01405, partial [Gammaproteobacteria bacterium]
MTRRRRTVRLETARGAIPCSITHRARVKRRMHLELDELGQLRVVAPRHWTEAQVLDLLQRHTDRVERFLDRARRRRLPPLRYHEGALHWF